MAGALMADVVLWAIVGVLFVSAAWAVLHTGSEPEPLPPPPELPLMVPLEPLASRIRTTMSGIESDLYASGSRDLGYGARQQRMAVERILQEAIIEQR
jgi:hypothetical protein